MKRKKRYSLLLALKIVILCVACGPSRTESEQELLSAGLPDSTKVSAAFVQEASLDHMVAIQLGRYASGQASDERLKNYGRNMIGFHRMALDRLRAMAGARGIPLADTMDAEWQRLVTNLVGEGGNLFDSTYIALMVQQEKKMINAYGEAAKSAEDQQVKSFAAVEMDSLIGHRDRMLTLKDSINLRKRRR